MKMKQRLELCGYKPRNQGPAEARRGEEGISPPSLEREHGPANTLILTSDLQDYKRINFCCF